MQVIRQVKNTKCYLVVSVMSVYSCMTNSSDDYVVDLTEEDWCYGCIHHLPKAVILWFLLTCVQRLTLARVRHPKLH